MGKFVKVYAEQNKNNAKKKRNQKPKAKYQKRKTKPIKTIRTPQNSKIQTVLGRKAQALENIFRHYASVVNANHPETEGRGGGGRGVREEGGGEWRRALLENSAR